MGGGINVTISIEAEFKSSTGERFKIKGYGTTRGEANNDARSKLINLTGDPNVTLVASRELKTKLYR